MCFIPLPLVLCILYPCIVKLFPLLFKIHYLLKMQLDLGSLVLMSISPSGDMNKYAKFLDVDP